MTDRFWEHKRSVVSTPSRSTGSTLTPDTLSCLAHPMLPNRFITRYDVNTTMKPRRPLNFQEMVDCSISCGFAVPSQESSQRDRGHF
ncbi:uncharacterized protein LOC135497900 isoform X2 [Lineus longissimus]|uniref:uncharacterized protein LOC135497900 isoform X2 n=1 Tax=Lineus longissimus TaxID=88925 RepID=UPI00315D89A0